MIDLTFTVTKATVLLTNGTDIVFLFTNHPCPFTKEGSPEQEPLVLKFDVSCGKGEEYCKNELKLTPEVINTRSNYKVI